MNKSGIEYLTHVWNFYTGCNHWKTGVCPVGDKCWAKSMAHRYNRSFEPTLHPEKLLDPLSLKKPGRIGVCFTGDLFGEWVDPAVMVSDKSGYADCSLGFIVHYVLRRCPQHQFFFLTKAPQNYAKWGTWPDNAWVGATVCNDKMLDIAVDKLEDINAKHKWLSVEPLTEKLTLSLDYALYYSGVSFVVIGGWSGGHGKQPEIAWIKEIIEACDKAGIKVFLKDNLRPLFEKGDDYHLGLPGFAMSTETGKLRQELPEVTK